MGIYWSIRQLNIWHRAAHWS